MAHLNARQWQRFSYHADVQLRRDAVAGAEHGAVGGVCVNLGLGGMQVRAAAAPEVGAAVSCQLLFADRWMSLPGSVRWRTPGVEDEGKACDEACGIEFGPLSPEQRHKVSALVASMEPQGHPVNLQLAQLFEPLTATALPTEGGLRVRVPLRLLAAGSELDVEWAGAASTLAKFPGQIVSSELHGSLADGDWQLEVVLDERETPRTRRYTLYETQPSKRRGRGEGSMRTTDPSPPSAADAEALPLPRLPKARAPQLVTGLVGLLLLGASATLVASLTVGSARAPAHLAFPALGKAARVTQSAVQPPAPPPQIDRKAASDDALIKSAPPAISPSAPAPPVGDRPTLRVFGDTSELFIPTQGSLEGLRTALWVEPLALVIDLPAGHVALGQSRYELRAGGVRAVSVAESRGVTHLRVFLDALLARYTTEVVAAGLLVRVKRDLRPLP